VSYGEEYSEDDEQYVLMKSLQTVIVPYLNMLLGLAYQVQAFIGANQFLRHGENYCSTIFIYNKPNFYPENNSLWTRGILFDLGWSF